MTLTSPDPVGLGSATELLVDDRVDGRRARRQRNRDALVDAWLDTVLSGDLEPSIATVAERSGVSYRSVFRYFENIHELFAAGLARGRANVEHLASIENAGEGPLDVRIDRFIEQRISYFEALAPLGRATRMHAPVRPELRAQLDEMESLLRRQTEEQFGPEFAALSPVESSCVRAAIDSLCSFESYEFMRGSNGLDTVALGRSLREALTRLLA